jgi:hypothetical protein
MWLRGFPMQNPRKLLTLFNLSYFIDSLFRSFSFYKSGEV